MTGRAAKSYIIIFQDGDINMYADRTYYEYHSLSNRYYMLDYGTVSSPDGSLVRRRISKTTWEQIARQIEPQNIINEGMSKL